MAWHYNKKVLRTFVHHTTQYSYANIEGLGWKRIRPNAPDGVTNLSIAFAAALANSRKVHVNVDSGGMITAMYLI